MISVYRLLKTGDFRTIPNTGMIHLKCDPGRCYCLFLFSCCGTEVHLRGSAERARRPAGRPVVVERQLLIGSEGFGAGSMRSAERDTRARRNRRLEIGSLHLAAERRNTRRHRAWVCACLPPKGWKRDAHLMI